MATTQTTQQMTTKQARSWLNAFGLFSTRLPATGERLELVDTNYNQYDLFRQNREFTLVSTKLA